MPAPQPFEIGFDAETLADLRTRIAHTRWPSEAAGSGWDLGSDLAYVRTLCEHWASGYDFRGFEDRLNALSHFRWRGLHFIHERAGGGGLPVLLVHGWPGAVIEFRDLIPRLLDAGHDVVVPSLPGYGWSDPPDGPLAASAVATSLRELMEQVLGYSSYAVQGGDWGSLISARMAFDSPATVAALHVNSVGVLPMPGDLERPPPSEAEQRYMRDGMRWRLSRGFHLLVQSASPQSLAYGLADSPAGLAGWLVEKYREWSDCGGEIERRFSKDDLCDFLTIYWTTASIGSSMWLYFAERADRWRLAPGERIEVPSAVADFPAEIVRPPREWAERLMDVRRYTEMPRGGHFAAFEEPELLAGDLVEFLMGIRHA